MPRPAILRSPGRLARLGSQRAQGLVEFAIIAPIFFISVLAVLESAFVINAQLSLDNAVRDGVRMGALCGTTIGNWTDPNGVVVSGGPAASPCPTAMNNTVRTDLAAFLAITGANPGIAATSPQPPYTSDCPQPAAGAPYSAPQGCLVQLTLTYQFSFFLNFLIGPDAPTITLKSQATAVSQ